MSRLAALRVLIAIAAVSAVAACTSPTAPTSPRRAPAAQNNDGISPDSTCRAGWVESGGFHC